MPTQTITVGQFKLTSIAVQPESLRPVQQFFPSADLNALETVRAELPEMFGSSLSLSSRGLSYIVDTIIVLRYVEVKAFIRRVITVLKSRGSDHDHSVGELIMQGGAVQIGQRFEHLAGVLSGLPYINGGVEAPASQTSAKE